MGTREREAQAEQERQRQEQERSQQQDRNSVPRTPLPEGDNELSSNPVIINK